MNNNILDEKIFIVTSKMLIYEECLQNCIKKAKPSEVIETPS